ncbi:protein of unknown function [Pseudomonas mediterranea]
MTHCDGTRAGARTCGPQFPTHLTTLSPAAKPERIALLALPPSAPGHRSDVKRCVSNLR